MSTNNSYYQKFELTEKLKNIEEIEAQDRNGINLLHELTKITTIHCPEKVRFNSIHILLNLKWKDNG